MLVAIEVVYAIGDRYRHQIGVDRYIALIFSSSKGVRLFEWWGVFGVEYICIEFSERGLGGSCEGIFEFQNAF